MSNMTNVEPDPNQSNIYRIQIKGHLDDQWSDWFEGLTIALQEDGNTLLTGQVVDQSALHGLLKRIHDLGMPLLSVNRADPDWTDGPDESHGCGEERESLT